MFSNLWSICAFFGGTNLLQESLIGYMKSQYYTTWRLTDASSSAFLSNGYRSGVSRFWTCESILLYQQNHLTYIQYKPRSKPTSMSPPVQVDSWTLYPLPQIFCWLLHSHIFNTDYQPLPRKATTMAEYLCEG